MPRDLANELVTAAQNGDKEAVIELLDFGADINTRVNGANILNCFARDPRAQLDILLAAAVAQTNNGNDWRRFVAEEPNPITREILSGIKSAEAAFLLFSLPSPALANNVRKNIPLMKRPLTDSKLGEINEAFHKVDNGLLQLHDKRSHQIMAVGGVNGIASAMSNVTTFLAATLGAEKHRSKVIDKFDGRFLNLDKVARITRLREVLSHEDGDDRGAYYDNFINVAKECAFGDESIVMDYMRSEGTEREEEMSALVPDEMMREGLLSLTPGVTPNHSRASTPDSGRGVRR